MPKLRMPRRLRSSAAGRESTCAGVSAVEVASSSSCCTRAPRWGGAKPFSGVPSEATKSQCALRSVGRFGRREARSAASTSSRLAQGGGAGSSAGRGNAAGTAASATAPPPRDALSRPTVNSALPGNSSVTRGGYTPLSMPTTHAGFHSPRRLKRPSKGTRIIAGSPTRSSSRHGSVCSSGAATRAVSASTRSPSQSSILPSGLAAWGCSWSAP